MFQVYFPSIKYLVMNCTSSMLWICFWNAFVFLFWVRSILEGTFKICIYCQTYLTLSWWRPLSYRNQSIDFLCKSAYWFLYDNGFHHERVKSILEVDFLNLKIYIQSLKYTWSILFELIHFFQTQKYTWGGLSKFMYLYSNSKVYFK